MKIKTKLAKVNKICNKLQKKAAQMDGFIFIKGLTNYLATVNCLVETPS